MSDQCATSMIFNEGVDESRIPASVKDDNIGELEKEQILEMDKIFMPVNFA